MEQKKLREFIFYFTHNKILTKEQQLKRDALLARDFCRSNIVADNVNENQLASSTTNSYALYHHPEVIVNFLHQFTEKKALALKYTSHSWDKNSEGNYPYTSFGEFKTAYLAILNNKEGRPLNGIRPLCAHLWQTVKNFLVNDDEYYPWSEFKLKVGYNKYVEKWMEENPDKQPFSMPLSAFPVNLRPKSAVNGKTLIYFSDAVDVFKHCIEFRDDDLFFTVIKIFKESPDHRIDLKMLNTLRGRSFYTDTELVKDALNIIAHNIFQRTTYPELQISCNLITNVKNEKIELRIHQIGSFSNRDVKDSKITAANGDGDLPRIIDKLKNLCDFAVESIFRVDDQLKHCRINYLSSQKGCTRVMELPDTNCTGFTYVLTFVSFSHE